ncbi:MAG: hypothetical protein JO227_12335 [Acetobacteraceae bacterium]|nr:hypothetical protein [Acetobacteraceae bacterium]
MAGLQAAFLLARGRADGLRYIEQDMAGAARSFWAVLVCLPAIVCLRLMDWVEFGLPQPDAAHAFALDILAYLIGWAGFLLLTWYLAPFFGVRGRWPQFVVAWNWCNVIENMLLVLGSLPGLLGAPTILAEAVQLFAIGWAVWIEWFAIRLTLGVGGFVAASLVILDQSIGLMLASWNFTILHS